MSDVISAPSEKIIREIRDKSDTVILSFSSGKDSIAAWLALRPHFKKIIPVYMWCVPGLEFIEKSLDYYEEFFETKIHRVPHPSFYRWLNNYVFQPPERWKVIARINFPEPDFDDILKITTVQLGYDSQLWAATGVRAADSPVRRIAVSKYGAINYNRMTFMPIWDWNKERLIGEIQRAKIKLPVDYKWFGRSFDGLDRRFLEPMRKYAPRDYEKVIKWFPLAELDILRADYARNGKDY